MNNMKLRICVTEKCNFKCFYCGSGGEGHLSCTKELSTSERLLIVKKLQKLGVESFRITGGEPFLYKDLFIFLKELKKIPNINKITMVTNGSLLTKPLIKELSNIGLKSITISLDAMDENSFFEITKSRSFGRVLENILELKNNGINVKINTVATKKNELELYKLLFFANKNGIDLKILDLFETDQNDWNNDFLELTEFEDFLKKSSTQAFIQYQDEGFGIPENVFIFDNMKVVTKNSKQGSCYCLECKKCKKYPCNTGIVSFVLTSDGWLKLCDEIKLDVRGLLNEVTSAETEKNIVDLFQKYNNSERFIDE